MHAKYEVSTFNDSKVIANVKVDNRQTNRQTNKQTGQKQYAPDHSIRGHKNDNNLQLYVKSVLALTLTFSLDIRLAHPREYKLLHFFIRQNAYM